MVKRPPASAGDVRGQGFIPQLGRSPGGGHGTPPQYSCLENPTDRGAWRATVHRLTMSWTRVKQLSMHACKGERLESGRAEIESERSSVVSNSLQPHGLYSPWSSPGQATGLGSQPFLSPGDLPNPRTEPRYPVFRADTSCEMLG